MQLLPTCMLAIEIMTSLIRLWLLFALCICSLLYWLRLRLAIPLCYCLLRDLELPRLGVEKLSAHAAAVRGLSTYTTTL